MSHFPKKCCYCNNYYYGINQQTPTISKKEFAYVISTLYNLVHVCWWRSNEVIELSMGLEKLKCWKTSLSSTAVSFSIC